MAKLDKNQTGLILGLFLALIHLVWAICIWVIPSLLQGFLDWIFKIHGLESVWKLLPAYPILDALYLIIMTFIFGYIFGFVFAWVWNMKAKK